MKLKEYFVANEKELIVEALKFVHVPNYTALLLDNKCKGKIWHESLNVVPAYINKNEPKGCCKCEVQTNQWEFPNKARLLIDFLEGTVGHFRYGGIVIQFLGIGKECSYTKNQIEYLKSRLRTPNKDIPIRFVRVKE